MSFGLDMQRETMFSGAAEIQASNHRWSQPPAVVMRRPDFTKQFSTFATLAAASDGSTPFR
jgi:hypothetical protein